MKALIFDTETTDLINSGLLKLDQQPSIIEFYGEVVDLETGTTQEELEHLFKPPRPITPEITRITNITNEMVANAPPFAAHANEIRRIIEESPAVIAHNVSFDREAVDIEFERIGMKVRWPALICTVEATICIKGFRLNLTSLHQELFGEPFTGAHRARHDVQALKRCAIELFKRGYI